MGGQGDASQKFAFDVEVPYAEFGVEVPFSNHHSGHSKTRSCRHKVGGVTFGLTMQHLKADQIDQMKGERTHATPWTWISLDFAQQSQVPTSQVTVTVTAISCWGPDWNQKETQTFVLHPMVALTMRGRDLMLLGGKAELNKRGLLTEDGMLRFRMEVEGELATLREWVNSDCPPDLLKNMFIEKDFMDFFIVGLGGEEIHCHRSVLAAASPVFQGMLASELQEASQKFVTIEERVEDLQALIHYLYLNEVAFDTDITTLLGLLRLADYYHLDQLVEVCAARLGPLISEDNILEILACVGPLWRSNDKNNQIFRSVMEHIRGEKALLLAVCADPRLHVKTWKDAAEATTEDSPAVGLAHQNSVKFQSEDVTFVSCNPRIQGNGDNDMNSMPCRVSTEVHKGMEGGPAESLDLSCSSSEGTDSKDASVASPPGLESSIDELGAQANMSPHGSNTIQISGNSMTPTVQILSSAPGASASCSSQPGPRRKTRRGGKKKQMKHDKLDLMSIPNTHNSFD